MVIVGGSPFEVKAFAFLIRPTNHERLSLPQLGESPRNDIVCAPFTVLAQCLQRLGRQS